jgi:cobalt-zinc-cadmium efflux system outer membrane protein
MSRIHSHHLFVCIAVSCAAIASCVLAPRGLDDERDRLSQQGAAYQKPFEERDLPELPSPATWQSVLERAFLANGELEAAWHEWSAALQRVTIAAGYPNTNLAPSFSYLLSGDGMKGWDRTTVDIGFDSMLNLSLPGKVREAGEVAFSEARAAGERFRAAKFRLQREVLDDWLAISLDEEDLRLAREEETLAQMTASTIARRVQSGSAGRDLVRAQVSSAEKTDAVQALEARLRMRRAQLNGRLARPADAPLVLSPSLPAPREIPADDAALLAAGVDQNPGLQALAFEAQGRADALELARLQYWPDFNPFYSFTGSIARSIGVGVSLPTTLPQIAAGVEAADAQLQRARALARQAHSDRAAQFVAALVALRESERQARWFETTILPGAERVVASTRQAYTTGSATFVEMLGAESTLLDVRRTLADARIERERRLAEIEELAGVDIETLSRRASDDTDARTARAEGDRHE